VVKKTGIVVALLVVLALAVMLVAQLSTSDEPAAATAPVPVATSSLSVSAPPTDAPERDRASAEPVVTTDEPGLYAAAIAAVVFGMDPRTRAAGDYRTLLMTEADPSLTETGLADLERLVEARVPADDMWQRMRTNAQWSQFVATQTWEPGSWQQVVTSGQAEPGWAMRNVTGVQTTRYVEHGAARETSRERTITVGMRCPASGAAVDRCRLVLLGASVVP